MARETSRAIEYDEFYRLITGKTVVKQLLKPVVYHYGSKKMNSETTDAGSDGFLSDGNALEYCVIMCPRKMVIYSLNLSILDSSY